MAEGTILFLWLNELFPQLLFLKVSGMNDQPIGVTGTGGALAQARIVVNHELSESNYSDLTRPHLKS